MASAPLVSDDTRDALFQAAYVMIKSGQRRRKFRTNESEGLVKTQFRSLVFVGTAGIEFNATVESGSGSLTVSYLVRKRDFQEIEEADEVAWVSEDDLVDGRIPDTLRRPNPLRKIAHGNN
jgi:hypothetical protein